MIPAESVDQFDTVITAIPQLTFTGYLFAILHFEGFDPGDIGKACDYAVTVLITQPPLHAILIEHLGFQSICRSAQAGMFQHILCVFLHPNTFLSLTFLYMIPGSKGLSPHELAHKWVKDLGTRPDMSIKVG